MILDWIVKIGFRCSSILWKVVTDKRRKIDISSDTCFFFKDIEDLKKYISNKSPNVKLKNKDMIVIHTKIKSLNYYCKKCSYILEQSNYEIKKQTTPRLKIKKGNHIVYFE